MLHTRFKLRFASRKFVRDARGGVVVLFAASLLPLLAMVAAAVEYARINSTTTKMQDALDSVAIMMGKDANTLTAAQIQTQANAYFSAAFFNSDMIAVTVSASYTSGSTSTLDMTAAGTLPMSLMNIFGRTGVDLKVATSVVLNGGSRLRVALALDNSGSMAYSGKIDALKTATTNLISQIQTSATNSADAYVAIVPFNNDVNVGTSNVTASWLDWSEWNAAHGTCSKNAITESTCLSKNGTWNTNHGSWTGCIADRGSVSGPSSLNYDINVLTASAADTQSLFPVESDSSKLCPTQAVISLTNNWSTLTSAVNSMSASGYTNQAIGIAHAWASLVGIGPYPTPPVKDPSYAYTDAVILLSDGLNTVDRWYNTPSSIDYRERLACENAKAAGVIVYTIQVNTGGDPTSSVLQNCASDPGKFFLLTSAGQLAVVFDQIGGSLSHLRIAK